MADLSPLVSFVVPCRDEEQVFPNLRTALTRLARSLEERYAVEFLLIDDGSRDRTWQEIEAFARDDRRVRGVSFSRNFGHQAALTCGYDLASGDAVITMDADLQDPPEVAVNLIEKWEQGCDVVYAIRQRREGETSFKRWTAAAFYRVLQWMGGEHVRPDSGDFRLMSRRAVSALQGMREHHRFIRGMVGWIGFRTGEVHYVRHPRCAGQTKYPLRKMLRFAIDGVVSFTFFPLRLAYWMALALTAASYGYLVYTLVRHYAFGLALVPGWASLLLVTVGFGTMNLLCLGLAGEYIGRIFEQTKHRPLYLVRDQLTGTAGRRGRLREPGDASAGSDRPLPDTNQSSADCQ